MTDVVEVGVPQTVGASGLSGPNMDQRFAPELGNHLEPEGHALLCVSTDGDAAGFDVEVAAERDLVNEGLRLYRVRPRASSR